MSCKCIKNGSDQKDFLLASETAGVYALGLTHYTCGNQKMALSDPSRLVIANLTLQPVGTPIDLDNGIYCQEFLLAGTVTYCPCGSCSPKTEYVTLRDCITTTSATTPTLTLGKVNASPKPVTCYVNNGCGCYRSQKPCTNQIAITTSIAVTAG